MQNSRGFNRGSFESEDFYKFLIENSLVGICIIKNNRIEFANKSLVDFLGFTPEELKTAKFWEIVIPENRGMIKERKGTIENIKGISDTHQVKVLKKNGEIFNAEIQERMITYNDQPATMCVVIDVSERRKAEEEIKRRNTELSILNQIGQRFSSTLDLDDLFRKIYEQASRLIDTSNFYIALFDQEKNEIRFEINIEKGKDKGKHKRTFSNGLTEYIISLGKHLLIQETTSQELKDSNFKPIGREAKSWLGVPIRYRNRVLGVIGIQNFERDNAYDQGHLSLLSIIADQAGIAINNALLFKKITEAEKEWEATFDSMQELIYVLDSSCKVIKVNSSFAQELKTTKRNILGENIFEFLKNKDASFLCPDPQVMKTKSPVQLESENPFNNKIYNLTYIPALDDEGQILKVILVGRNITLQKKMEQLMLKMEKLSTLRELTSILTHEVRTPLHSISSAVEQLKLKKGESLEELDVELLNLIHTQSDKLYNMLSDFLVYTKLEDLNLTQVNANLITQEVARSLENEIKSRNITLDQDLDQEVKNITADSERIKQVVSNILLNAIQALPSGGKITLSTKDEKANVKIIISDTGEGIPQKNLKLIFSPFYSNKEEGTGLGLSIVERIVKAHGGNIDVDSQPGKGSSFVINLPKKS